MQSPFGKTKIEDLKAGDHLCFFFSSEAEHQTVISAFLAQGLAAGEKVLYLADNRTPRVILGYLKKRGIKGEPYLHRGQLQIINASATYLAGGLFDPDRMITCLKQETEQALAEGYPALRVTGEMGWATRGYLGSERLTEYEARLNEFMPGSRCLAICQYDRRQFDPVLLMDILATHPRVIIGTEVMDNIYYLPPGEFLSSGAKAAKLAHFLDNLAERQRAEATLARQAHELTERLKELNCLLSIARLTEQPDLSLEDILQGIVELIPPAWQYSEITAARLVLGEKEFTTKNFRKTPWCLASDLCLHGEKAGRVEVCHLEPRPEADEGPFLKEERSLLNAIAGLTGRIAERLQAQEDLRQSELKYRTLVEHVPAITYVAALDPSSTTTYVSPQVEAMLGFTPTDYQAAPDIWKKQLHPEDRERVLAQVTKSHASGEPFSSEYRMFAKDGRIVWFRDEAWIVKDGNGRPLFLQGVMLDITERRQAEEALREHKKQLERVVEERTAALKQANLKLRQEIEERRHIEEALEKGAENIKIFAYSVIHDLKNPAIGIYGVSNLLKKHYSDLLDERGRKYCDQIMRASEQIATLLKKITAYIVTKEAPLNIKSIDLKEIFHMVKDEFSEQLELRQIRWREPKDPPEIRADGFYILRALRNLVDNALKYGGEKLGEIALGYESDSHFHKLSVHDDGVGLKLADPEKIFTAFQRFETAEGVEGSGLGLAIVKEIAERHHGRVWVESSQGRGTTFFLSIAKESDQRLGSP
jgi:PAS domain S-box-containing protein